MRDVLSLADRARTSPDAPALVTDEGTWTWSALHARAEATADNLLRLDPHGRQPWALRATNRAPTVFAILACLARGRTFVPIHPRWTDVEMGDAVDRTGCSLLLDDAALDALDTAAPRRANREPVASDAALAILFTSGTSGRSRAAVLSRRAFAASAVSSSRVLPCGPGTRWLLALPLCHVGGLSILTRCLVGGSTIVLAPRADPEELRARILRAGVTRFSVVPTLLRRMLDAGCGPALATLDAVIVGGAACPPALLAECAERGIRARTTYGLTEACSQVTLQREDAVTTSGGRDDAGAPLPDAHVSIVRADGSLAETEEPGAIRIAGPMRFDGYLGEPALDRHAPFDTGDVGFLDARGALHVLSRRTDLVVSGGENVYPAEVERALEACPGIVASLVFGVEDPVWGQRVAAGLVVAAGMDPETVVRAAARRLTTSLARFKHPRGWCALEQLPLNAMGKPDRGAARRQSEGRLARWPV